MAGAFWREAERKVRYPAVNPPQFRGSRRAARPTPRTRLVALGNLQGQGCALALSLFQVVLSTGEQFSICLSDTGHTCQACYSVHVPGFTKAQSTAPLNNTRMHTHARTHLELAHSQYLGLSSKSYCRKNLPIKNGLSRHRKALIQMLLFYLERRQSPR